MKKIILYLMMLTSLFNPLLNINAQVTEDSLEYKILSSPHNEADLVTVNDFNIIDGDTADLILDRPEEVSIKARFLLIDSPELKKNPYGQMAKERVQELFQQANTIQIQYDKNKKDQYGRDLVYIWLDDILLQEILVTEGYAIARYIKGFVANSPYAETIYTSQDYALNNKLNIWNDEDIGFLSQAEFRKGTTNPYSMADLELTDSEAQTMVFVAPYSGQKFHYDENCRGLRTANYLSEMTLEQAISSGYTLCGYED